MSKNQSKSRSSSPHAGEWQLSPPPFTASTESVLISSLDIARVTGKEHRNVLRDIKTTLEEAGIVALKFERHYTASNGKQNPCYHLPRYEMDLVISGYSVKYRGAIIRRWYELENSARQSAPSAAVAWVLGQIAKTMPWAKVLELILPLHGYGSLAANGQPRTGFRRPAFVAAPHRTAAATDFHEHTVMVKLLARQQELPFREGGTRE